MLALDARCLYGGIRCLGSVYNRIEGGCFMYSNINSKIKALAKVICWLGIIASVIIGIVIIAGGASMGYYYGVSSGSMIIPGLLTIVLGSVCAWASSLVLYAFGELGENTQAIRKKLEQ